VTAAASRALYARMGSVHAEERVADALLGVALDILQPFACDYLSTAEYGQLCAAIRWPVSAATEAALMTFVSELICLRAADPRIEARLNRTQQDAHAVAE
jgi:hypothetical protein